MMLDAIGNQESGPHETGEEDSCKHAGLYLQDQWDEGSVSWSDSSNRFG